MINDLEQIVYNENEEYIYFHKKRKKKINITLYDLYGEDYAQNFSNEENYM